MYDIAIAGGGLSGLTFALSMSSLGWKVILFEKEKYPFHKVCGEYISTESIPFLERIGLDIGESGAKEINRLTLTSPRGKSFSCRLESGGVAIRRYTIEKILADVCRERGVEIIENCNLSAIKKANDHFTFINDTREFHASIGIGSFGKHSRLERSLDESEKTKNENEPHYVGIKYYARGVIDPGTIQLHLYKNGYCGLVETENGEINVCYLVESSELKNRKGSIPLLESELLFRNPVLKERWNNLEFLP